MKRFCVIARDYEHHVPRSHDATDHSQSDIFKGIQSLKDQEFKDFSVVICHDGPKDRSYEDEGIDFGDLDVHIINTPTHLGNWGHHSADYAMRYAYEHELGQYFVQFNIDNVFYPDAFRVIDQALTQAEQDGVEIVIFGIRHWKAAQGRYFSGNPPKLYNIDSMQLVASRAVWKNMQFWFSQVEVSDGIIYQAMCLRHPFATIDNELGINF